MGQGDVLTYTYNDPYNNLLETVDLNGSIIKSYTYDGVKGWKTNESLNVLGTTGTINHTIDINDYDDIGRIEKETKEYLDGAVSIFEYIYDGANNVLAELVNHTSASGDSLKYTKEYKYDKGVRLINTIGVYPEVNFTPINTISYNDNDWMTEKIISSGGIIDYSYNPRGWLKKINGISPTYPPDFVACDEDPPVLDCEGPFIVTDISILLNCVELATEGATVIYASIATSTSSENGVTTADTTTFTLPFNGGSTGMSTTFDSEITASIPAGGNPQSTIEGIIQEIIDCLEDPVIDNDDIDISTIPNGYSLASLEAMLLEELQGASIGGVGPGEEDNNVSIPTVLFGMDIFYDQGNPELEAPSQFNGNISWMQWHIAGEDFKHQYGFDYDGVNRLLQAKYKGKNLESCEEMPTAAYDVVIGGYDNMGNISGLTRNGFKGFETDGTTPIYGEIDNLGYSYSGGNILGGVTESSNVLFGFKNSATYGYDGTGNLVTDSGKGISAISYNYLDLPQSILLPTGEIQFVYDANGRKLKQSVIKAGNVVKEYLYCDGIEYLDGSLDAIYHEEGRIVYDGDIPNNGGVSMTYKEFFLKDHLGNTRVRFVDKNGDGIIQIDTLNQMNNELTASYHYYPFGMEWGDKFFNPQEVLNKYRYNGKEFIEDFGLEWSDYGARWYDAAVGRFLSVDPLADQTPGWSSYHYTFNNPLRYTDPDGRSADDIIVTSKDGTELFTLDDGKEEITYMTAQAAYKQGIQWFEPQADNYMELIGISAGASSDKLNHFTSEDISSFAGKDRFMFSYRPGGSGDWKADGKPGDGYLLSTVDDTPYWTDAIGQIPFAANKYRNEIGRKKATVNGSITNTLKAGQKYGDGNPFNPKADYSSQYDNFMILRGALWQAGKQSLTTPVSASNAKKYGLK